MTESTTYQVLVATKAYYISEQSVPEAGRFVFGYTITLRNTGQVPARLLTRHWQITDANGKTEEVHGPGVVGEHPHLGPGEIFQYSSGAVLETPVGAMQGHYEMLADDGASFQAPIAPFRLSIPGAIH
jgi:ApaG protein